MSSLRAQMLDLGDLIPFRDLRHLYTEAKLERIDKDGERFYISPENGKALVSMSTLAGSMTKQAIQEWRQRVGAEEANRVSRQATQRGTKLHSLFEMYVGNETEKLKSAAFTPETLTMFKAGKKVLDRSLTEVHGLETALYSSEYRIAGRTDTVGVFDGVLSVIDYKNSLKPKKREWIQNYFVQGTGYAVMWGERYGVMPEQIVILVALGDGTTQVFKEKTIDHIPKLKEVRWKYYLEHEKLAA